MAKFLKSETTVTVELEPRQIHKNHIDELIQNLRKKLENKCHPHLGYIKKNSIQICKIEDNRITGSKFNGTVTYKIKFSFLHIKPYKGSKLLCNVIKKNDSGLLATAKNNRNNLPYIILIPRILDDTESIELIDKVVVNENEIEVEVLDFTLQPPVGKSRAQYLIIGKILTSKYSTNDTMVPLPILTSQNLVSKEFDLGLQDSEPVEWQERKEYTENNLEFNYSELEKVKNNIGKISDWNTIKKIINNYELITGRNSVSALKNIVSRAFYKMHEMIKLYPDLLDYDKDQMRILNLAESPGGFAQAIMYNRQGKDDEYALFSVEEQGKPDQLWNSLRQNVFDNRDEGPFTEFKNYISVTRTSPEYTKAKDHRFILGDSDLGDLTDINNIRFILDNLRFGLDVDSEHRWAADLVTADGASSSSDVYNKQEMQHYRLFLAEVTIALASQADGGSFVLKIYDILTRFTVDLISILCLYYTNVSICKPITSRQANSEKYIVCTGFNANESGLKKTVDDLLDIIENWPTEDHHNVTSLLKIPPPDELVTSIKNYNSKFIKVQINNIQTGLEKHSSLKESGDNIKDMAERALVVQREATRNHLKILELPTK